MGSTLFVCAQAPVVESKANQILRAMSDYVASLKQFEIQTENTLEVVLRSGQKNQFDNPATLLMNRPDKFRAGRKGDLVDQELYYDGKVLTLIMRGEKVYASADAPPTIEEVLDFAREYLDVFAPAGDLLYKNSYDILMEDVVTGFYVGKSVVDDVQCHHLAFRGNEVDWQIWVEAGSKPLPKKFIITSKWIAGSPQFSVHVRDWNLSPKITETTFVFTPPEGVRR